MEPGVNFSTVQGLEIGKAEAAGVQPALAPKPPEELPSPQLPVKNRRRALLGVIIAVIAIVSVALWRNSFHRAGSVSQGVRTAIVTRGDFVRNVRLQGTVEALSFYSIAAPRLSGPGSGSLIVTKLASSGKPVKKGELLVEFDRQTQIRNALDRQADYVDFVEQIKKKQADQIAAKAADDTELLAAEDAMKSAALELKRNEIVSQIDAEKNQANYDQAKATYEQLKQTYALKRASTRAELQSLEIQRDRAKNAMQYAQKNMKRLQIRSPIDGIVVLNSIFKNAGLDEVQEGDEVRPGITFMQVVNAGSMQVRSRVNQADIYSLRAGQRVRIGLDAYPDLAFAGKVVRVGDIGVTSGLSQKVRGFQALFTIDGSDPRLMPDLSASVDVELERIPSVVIIPRDSVKLEDGKAYVEAWNGSTYKSTSVRLGATNDTDVIAESGLSEGTRILRNPN
jgi:HlyD family secretion protein